jgi:predicted dithiol-disulfide oxidoreductase (DUF899 family)
MSIDDPGATPSAVDQASYLAQVDALRIREKAHMREGDAISAARRRLPMTEIDALAPLIGGGGPTTLLDAFEGRLMLIAYYFMWQNGKDAADQCEGCTFFTTQVRELANIHSRNVTYATLCQGPFSQSTRYRDFMGWTLPWYSAEPSLETLLAKRRIGMMNLICYLRQGSRVFETYWTTMRGVEAMDNSYRLLDLTIYGRQEDWEDSPPGWPQGWGSGKARMRSGGRPIAQWSHVHSGHSDDHGPVSG